MNLNRLFNTVPGQVKLPSAKLWTSAHHSACCGVRLGPDADPAGPEQDHGLLLDEARPQLKPPSRYKVIMLNDDYTPMDFVVEVLEGFFSMSREQATQVMLRVHTEGKAVCGVFSRDVAETKAAQVNEHARDCQHPLMCQIEREE